MKKMRYISKFLNGDIGKGSWINVKNVTVNDMFFMQHIMDSNKFIKEWSIEYK